MNQADPIPTDFPAGWQEVSHTPAVIKQGDILVSDSVDIISDAERRPIRKKEWAWGLIDKPVENAAGAGFTVYRKMAVAKQGDANRREWEHALTPGKEKAATHDAGKPPLAHLPWAGVEEVAMVQAYGQEKYKDFNNYRKGMEIGRNLSCAVRHISDFMQGESLDPESKRSHLAHAACRLLFVLQNLHDGTAIDDRFKPKLP
jgi:hypothetical protein